METAQKVRVLAPNGDFVYAIHGQAALHMLQTGQAIYTGKPGRKLYEVYLPIPTHKPAHHGDGPTLARQMTGVSKNRQMKGGKTWIERLDNSDGGLTGGRRSVLFPNNAAAPRFAAGKAEQPAMQ